MIWADRAAIAITAVVLYVWLGWWALPLWIAACLIAFVCLVLGRVAQAIWRVMRGSDQA